MTEATEPARLEMPPVKSKAEMLATADEQTVDKDWVYIDEWESPVEFRRLSGLEYEEVLEQARIDSRPFDAAQGLHMIQAACVNPTFDLADPNDLAMLERASTRTLHVLVTGISILADIRRGRIADYQRSFHVGGGVDPEGTDAEPEAPSAPPEAGAASDSEGEAPDAAAAPGEPADAG